MSLSESDILLIEKYFEEDITEEEGRLFNEKSSQSAEFAEQVALQRTMLTSLRRNEDKELRLRLKEKARQVTLSESKSTFRWSVGVAATLLILIMGITLLPSYKSLYDKNFDPLLEQPVTRGESTSYNSVYENAMKAYSAGDHLKALEIFEKISDPDLIHEVSLYMGNCYLITDNSEKAIVSFLSARQSANKWISNNADWYLALALIKARREIKAKEVLMEITISGSPYKSKAKKLLKKLQWRFY